MRKCAGLMAIWGCVGVLAAVSSIARAQDLPAVPLAWESSALDRMVGAIAEYQRLAEGGGWPQIPASSSSMRPNWVDPRVGALRQRLVATGDLPAAEAATGTTVDPATVAAVGRFQKRHGLTADGIAGRRTVEIMNVPVADRAAQLMVNYDRLRALARALPATGIVVNIPAATLQLMVDGRVVLASRVVVGRRNWQTPLLQGTIEEIELNPYWTVPPRIARAEILPKIAADRGYLAANAMRVMGGSGEVGADTVDWSRFAALGYRLRQDPGANNPLGAIKFVFPNPYAVYLHDTPAKQVFARPDRAVSHGCIRVERAFDLALQLLAGDPAWSASALRDAVDSVRNRHVRLARPIPIRTVYLTAWPAPDGTVHFRGDVYDRDAAEAARRIAGASPEPLACGSTEDAGTG